MTFFNLYIFLFFIIVEGYLQKRNGNDIPKYDVRNREKKIMMVIIVTRIPAEVIRIGNGRRYQFYSTCCCTRCRDSTDEKPRVFGQNGSNTACITRKVDFETITRSKSITSRVNNPNSCERRTRTSLQCPNHRNTDGCMADRCVSTWHVLRCTRVE